MEKALEAAGIKYSDIKVELLDFCECEICHARKAVLAPHIRHKHHMETEDYRLDYPEARLISEKLWARRPTKMKCKELPHWEPFWTAEYALDRLWARYEQGLPINCQAVFPAEKCGLYMLGKYFESCDTTLSLYDKALRKLGLNPGVIRRMPYSLESKEEVIAAIIKHKKMNLPLDYTRVRLDRHKGSVLHHCAQRMFGSWKKAIEAAGLDYRSVRNVWKYPTREKLLDEILRRNKAGLPLNSGALFHDAINSDQALCRKGIEIFGSWKKAIEAAGIRYSDIAVSGKKK